MTAVKTPLDDLETGEDAIAGLRCPKCGVTDGFNIVFRSEGRMDKEGLEDHEDVEWDDESPCSCRKCVFHGSVADFTVGWVPNPDAAWRDDAIQFPRLLAEIEAIGLTRHMKKALCDAMDLEWSDIAELLDRAQAQWDGRKADLKERADRMARGHREVDYIGEEGPDA